MQFDHMLVRCLTLRTAYKRLAFAQESSIIQDGYRVQQEKACLEQGAQGECHDRSRDGPLTRPMSEWSIF